MLKTFSEKVDPKNAALLIVDVQNDFCHEQGAVGKRGRDVSTTHQMVDRLEQLVAEARRVGLKIIHIRLANNKDTASHPWVEAHEKIPGRKAYPTCIEGTWGAEFYRIVPQPGELVVTKHRYSAFHGTNLDVILKTSGIKSLIMAGLSTNVCVDSTARDGFMRDYYIVFLSDCTEGTSVEEHQSTLRTMTMFFGQVTTSEEVINAWAKIKS